MSLGNLGILGLPLSVLYLFLSCMFAQDIDSRLFVEVNFFNLNYCIEFIDIVYIWQRRAFREMSFIYEFSIDGVELRCTWMASHDAMVCREAR